MDSWFLNASRGGLALWVLLHAGLAAPSALSAQAREHAQRLDYPAALATAQRAVEEGGALPEDSLSLYAFLGEMAATVGEDAQALRAFSVVLSLHPDYVLARGSSPKLEAQLAKARRQLKGARVALHARSQVEQPGRIRTQVSLQAPVFDWEAGLRLYVSEGGSFVAKPLAGLSPGVATWRCESEPCAHFVALLDPHGNELLRLGSPYAPLRVEGGQPQRPLASSSAEPKRWLRAGPLFALGAMVAAGASVAFGLSFAKRSNELDALLAHPEDTRFETARQVDEARRRDYALMFVGGGIAVGSGGAALLTW